MEMEQSYMSRKANGTTEIRTHKDDVTKGSIHELTERQKVILLVIKENPLVTIPEMSLKMNVVTRTIKRDIEVLKSKGFLKREGSRKEGHWEIVDESVME